MYEMLIQPERAEEDPVSFRQQSAVYTDEDVAAYGSHEAYADHLLEGVTVAGLNGSIPAPERTRVRVRVWERADADWDGVPRFRGETLRDWVLDGSL